MKKGPFDQIEGNHLIDGYFRELSDEKPESTIWIRGLRYVSQVVFQENDFDARTFIVSFAKDFPLEAYKEEVALLEDHCCFFSIPAARGRVFFKARFLDVDQLRFKFKIPSLIYPVQRRLSHRVSVAERRPPFLVEFVDPNNLKRKVTKKMLDLSQGGLGFLLSQDEQSSYFIGSHLHDVSFDLGSRTIRCSAEVRSLVKRKTKRAGELSSGVKIGVQLLYLSVPDQYLIDQFVQTSYQLYLEKYS